MIYLNFKSSLYFKPLLMTKMLNCWLHWQMSEDFTKKDSKQELWLFDKATCPAHQNFLGLTTITILVGLYKSRRYSPAFPSHYFSQGLLSYKSSIAWEQYSKQN
jgi:hypothetical protein